MNDFRQAETSPIRIPMVSSDYIGDNRNMIIIVLIVLLILAVLGINILYISGNVLQYTTNIFEPFIFKILSLIGYSSGTIINKTADIAGDTAKLGVDIAEGTVHSIGDLLKNASNPNIDNETRKNLDDAINIANKPFEKHEEKKEGFNNMNTWFYDGKHQDTYGYINIDDYAKSISGQVFPSQSTALNPLLSDPNRIVQNK